MVAIFKNIWNTSATKNYHPISVPFVVNEFFGKLVNNKLDDHLEKLAFFWSPVWLQAFLFNSMTSGLPIQPQFWQEFWQGLANWHSLMLGTLQSRSKCDQASDFGQQLGAWSGLLISLLKKLNLLHLTSQRKQGVIKLKLNKSNFDEKSFYDARIVFLL